MTDCVRNDIEFCSCCGNFYSLVTGRVVDVPYTEMPAEVAIYVMGVRMGMTDEKGNYKSFRRNGKKKKRR